MSEARVYSKTQAGIDEMHLRLAGLTARVRQLLILVDGKRSVAELRRMMLAPEMDDFLSLLELKNFVECAPLPVLDSGPPFEQERQALGATVSSDVAVMEARPVTAVIEVTSISLQRATLATLLSETIGPMSDEMTTRIKKSTTAAELQELFRASITVVELMSGQGAAERFVEKMKQLGWEF